MRRCWPSQKLLCYCQHIKNLLNAFLHSFLQYSRFYGPMNEKVESVFDHTHSKTIETTFSFPEFAPALKKICLLYLCIFQKQSVLEACDQVGHTHFDHAHPKNLRLTFNLCEFLSSYKKPGYFIDLIWRYGSLKNPAIWLSDNILAHISGTNIFPNMGFVQKRSKYYKFSLETKFSKN